VSFYRSIAEGCLLAVLAGVAGAQDGVPKQVYLVEDGTQLIASNARFSRFDEFKLSAQERVLDSAEGDGVFIVVTNQRLIAYGSVSGWRPVDRVANERVLRIDAEDYAGLVITTERLLNFNGESGIWAIEKRNVSR
jgi:hypothetical protein